jgi:hypothetical protein
VLPLLCDAERFFLVAIENKVFAKESRCFRQDDAFSREDLEVGAALECGIELEYRIGPEPPLVEFLSYEIGKPRVEDVDKAFYVALVFANNLVPERKYIKRHRLSS